MAERPFWQRGFGKLLPAAMLIAEACSQDTGSKKAAEDFTRALINGDTHMAASFFVPNLQHSEYLDQYIHSLAKQLQGCEIDNLALQGSTNVRAYRGRPIIQVTFKEPCGEGPRVESGKIKLALVNIEMNENN